MQILTQLTFSDTEEYQKFCAAMVTADLGVTKKDKGEPQRPVADKPAAAPAPAPKEKAPAPKPTAAKAAPVEVSEEEEGTTEKESELSYAVVKEAVLKVSTEKGKVAARRALAAIGATAVGPHIAEEDYPTLMAACAKELA